MNMGRAQHNWNQHSRSSNLFASTHRVCSTAFTARFKLMVGITVQHSHTGKNGLSWESVIWSHGSRHREGSRFISRSIQVSPSTKSQRKRKRSLNIRTNLQSDKDTNITRVYTRGNQCHELCGVRTSGTSYASVRVKNWKVMVASLIWQKHNLHCVLLSKDKSAETKISSTDAVRYETSSRTDTEADAHEAVKCAAIL